MLENEAYTPPPIKPKPFRYQKLVNNLINTAAALALMSEPSPAQAQSLRPPAEHPIPDYDKKAIQNELQDRYGLFLEGSWDKNELLMLQKTVEKLPPDFIGGHPGIPTTLRLVEGFEYDAYCQCAVYAHLGIEYSYEDLVIAKDWFQDQSQLDHVLTHEFAHGRSLIYQTSGIDLGRPITIVWYQDEVEDILGQDFSSFKEHVWETINEKYPKPVQYLTEYYRNELSPYNAVHGPQNFEELFFDPRYRTIQKVNRWVYALTTDQGAPTEFAGVLAEWYLEGKDQFLENCDGIVDESIAEKLYNFMRVKFFSGYEYDEEKLISVPNTNKIMLQQATNLR